VDRPVPASGQVLVRVKAAGINPGEAAIRKGRSPSDGPRRSRPGRAVISPA
jgi:NADPH:quinone reductase and related Zn-dependent oxidoreductases